jgi:hypothetical protein
MKIPIPFNPIEGKTYSLFGKSNSTNEYYILIKSIADHTIEKFGNPQNLLEIIQKYSTYKRELVRISSKKETTSPISYIIHLLNLSLPDFTENVATHLKNLPILKFWDRRLSTSREQYHLYMLEIEVTNLLNIELFKKADKKIALLPYCLRDFDTECKSKPDEFDYQCRFCSKICYQNYTSRLLKENQVDAYIWMGADIKKYAKEIFKKNQSLGILGIACIPELVFGMRKCQKYQIPTIGIPLDANRCVRWMGEFHKNSINLERLELLVKQ